ncbi:NAD(P)/FAD-dependent oxidoreductase [Luteimonas saliphila]|uniref:NAD(P)/FAD-dependent oxidoreductase n=1 Tax=Luteimonas saliphila TaxID=2804919 RepID=UPI00192D3C65|nr:FAD/NAD(P)-binding oxidoreductase [Luteimonas saliphila]
MTERRLQCDVAIVGAGPAGLAAAQAAASHGATVLVVDPQPQPGGQVWRQDVVHGAPLPAQRLRSALHAFPRVSLCMHAEVVANAGRRLLVRSGDNAIKIDYQALVLATGARELLLPFPGWTLPGVTGAGGAQALAKQGWPVRGSRVVVAGSGPLLLASARTLQDHGAKVLGIHEQAARSEVTAFAAGLWRWPGKAVQAAQLRFALREVPYRTGSHVLRALGEGRLQAVELQVGGRRVTLDCDQLACAFGLVPNVELAQMLGCELQATATHPHVVVDERQGTSVDGVYAAGEACGIGGLDCALAEGGIAGHAAAGHPGHARALLPRRRHARRFAASLARRFALRDAVRTTAEADTTICRCEDVSFAALAPMRDAREARLLTRCGMGPCQGRICGAALSELGRFPWSGVRLPVFPIPLGVLATYDAGAATDPFPGV